MASASCKSGHSKATKLQHVRFADFEAIGFDLDHTIARYRIESLHQLCYESALRYLVERAYYHPDIAKEERVREFSKRGLIVDRKAGNLLKLDRHMRVERAYHAFRQLNDREIETTYGKERTLKGYNGIGDSRYFTVMTFFESWMPSLFATLVYWTDTRPVGEVNMCCVTYDDHFNSIFDAIACNFAEWNKGWFFPAVHANPEKYLYRRPGLRKWLLSLRNHREKTRDKTPLLFISTNSTPEYTDLLLSYCIGDDWSKIFDLVLTSSQKPNFFSHRDKPFYECRVARGDGIKPDLERINVATDKLKLGEIYACGNSHVLQMQIKSWLDKAADSKLSVCYFGDQLHSDIAVPIKTSNWCGVAVVEELEELEREQSYKFAPIINTEDYSHTPKITNANHPASNTYWGSYFHCDTIEGSVPSYWLEFIRKSGAIAIPDVERLAYFEAAHAFAPSDLTIDLAALELL